MGSRPPQADTLTKMAKTVRIDAATAALMVKLAKKLDELSPTDAKGNKRLGVPTGALVTFVENLANHKVFGALGSRTQQWARLLRNAYRVYGKRLERLLLKFGPTKLYTLAKVRDAKKIIRPKKRIRVPGVGNRQVDDVSSRTLGKVLWERATNKPLGKQRAKLPGDLFTVPTDTDQILDFLYKRLKSVRRIDEATGPRMRVRKLDASDLEHLAQLKEILEIYLLLVDIVLQSEYRPMNSGRRHVKPGTDRPARQGQLITNEELLKKVEELRALGRRPPGSRQWR